MMRNPFEMPQEQIDPEIIGKQPISTKKLLSGIGKAPGSEAVETSMDATLGAASVQGLSQLLGGLLSQRAKEQMQAQAIQAQAAQQQTASEAESLVKAQQQQQDALSRLMASYRSALLK